MACALPHILVVSLSGWARDDNTEPGYVDAFVRNAFGNFLEVVREVADSPAMGTFLTHEGSSFGRFPNDNYGREVR